MAAAGERELSLSGYVVRRLLQAVPVGLGVTILVFFLIHLVPGDPARTILGNQATAPRVALLRHEWGLDRPLPVQYAKFMGRLLHGDLGSSLFYGVGAGHLVLERLPVTLWLIGFGTFLSVLIAVPLSVIAATHRDRLADHAVRVVPLVGLGFPAFWLGIMLSARLRPPPRASLSRRRLRHRVSRPPALDVPAGAHRRPRYRADPRSAASARACSRCSSRTTSRRRGRRACRSVACSSATRSGTPPSRPSRCSA